MWCPSTHRHACRLIDTPTNMENKASVSASSLETSPLRNKWKFPLYFSSSTLGVAKYFRQSHSQALTHREKLLGRWLLHSALYSALLAEINRVAHVGLASVLPLSRSDQHLQSSSVEPSASYSLPGSACRDLQRSSPSTPSTSPSRSWPSCRSLPKSELRAVETSRWTAVHLFSCLFVVNTRLTSKLVVWSAGLRL